MGIFAGEHDADAGRSITLQGTLCGLVCDYEKGGMWRLRGQDYLGGTEDNPSERYSAMCVRLQGLSRARCGLTGETSKSKDRNRAVVRPIRILGVVARDISAYQIYGPITVDGKP